MKKIYSILMVFATMALFVGCGGDDDSGSSRKDEGLEYTVCGLCNGTGIRSCETCDNTGLCDFCHGDGVCDFCDGDGLVGEPGSNPDGTINLVMTCSHTNFVGASSYKCACSVPGKCRSCDGNGGQKCNGCDGKGVVAVTPSPDGNPDSGSDNHCWACSGTGECDWCDSSGYCFMCDGKGWYRYGADMKGCNLCNDPGYGIIATGLVYKYGDGWCGHCGGTHKCNYCGGKGYID